MAASMGKTELLIHSSVHLADIISYEG